MNVAQVLEQALNDLDENDWYSLHYQRQVLDQVFMLIFSFCIVKNGRVSSAHTSHIFTLTSSSLSKQESDDVRGRN